MMRRFAAPIVVVLALVVAACADDDVVDETTTTAPAETTTTTEAADETTTTTEAAPTGPIEDVEIDGFAFRPAEVTIEVGTTVRWTNFDAVSHTATADDGTFNGTAPYEFTFTEPGEYPYFCAIHPEMRAVVIVEG